MLKCENCAYCWCDEGENVGRCHYDGPDRDAPCNWTEPEYKYTFYVGDDRYDTNDYGEVSAAIRACPDDVYAVDNEYGLTYSHGDWS